MTNAEYTAAITAKTGEYHVVHTKYIDHVDTTNVLYMEIAGADAKKPALADLVKSAEKIVRSANILPANGSLYLATDTKKMYTWNEGEWTQLFSFAEE